MKKASLIAIALMLFCVSTGHAQETKTEQQPKTKLETFEAQIGTAIIKSFTTIGSVTGTGSVSVDCREIINAASDQKQHGIVIEVSSAGRLERQDRSFIDYEEIDPLLKGIDYILTVNRNATKLDNFEAVYKTKDDLRVITFSSSSGKIEAAVSSGYISPATAYFSTEKLVQLRGLIAQAKQKLDSIK